MLNIDGYTIELTRGDNADIEVIPINEMTKYPYEFHEGDTVIFRMWNDEGIVLEKNCGIVLENNECTLVFIENDTLDLDFKKYHYEIELVTYQDKHYTFIADQTFIIGVEGEQHE